MMEISFVKWMQLKETNEAETLPPGYNPFVTLQQKAGDIAYFGVHDLSKYYKQNGRLPDLDPGMLQMKAGEVVNADPIEQTITIATNRAPFHYGYHKLEDEKARTNRKTDDQGRMMVKIPVTHLQNISHMMNGVEDGNIWLVVDGNTKYQQGLMKEIRRKEIERAHGGQPQQPQSMGFDQPNSNQQPQMPPAPAPMPGNNAPTMPPSDDEQKPMKPMWKMQGREVVPLQVAHYVPTITSYDRHWKRYVDSKHYEYKE